MKAMNWLSFKRARADSGGLPAAKNLVSHREGAAAKYVLAASMMLANLIAEPALGLQAEFRSSPVRGIRVEAPPRQLYSNPDLLSSESICAGIDSLRPAIRGGIDYAVAQINAALQPRLDRIALVRHGFTVSPSCRARSNLIGSGSGILITVNLPANRFVTNITNGTLLGQRADPRISLTFDTTVAITIPLPTSGGGCLGAPRATVTINNITLPEGQNLAGIVVEAGIDIGTSVYDYFNDGRVGRLLARGVSWNRAVPPPLAGEVNRHLCGSGIAYRTIESRYAPGDELLISLSTGARVEDARCRDGYVWRAIRADDLVCVLPAVRSQTRQDTASAATRAVPRDLRALGRRTYCQPNGGCQQLGSLPPQPCLPGFVWREAIANDRVCVTPQTRAQAAADNREARMRRRDYEAVLR